MTLNVGDMILTGTPHGVGPIKVDYDHNIYQRLEIN